jgi:hypothetical protein
MQLTNDQLEWLKIGFEETLYHWCHPWGDEPPSHMGCTQEEYEAAAKEYYYNAIGKDQKELVEDWEYTWEETENDFKEEYDIELSREVYMPVFLECLKEHLID